MLAGEALRRTAARLPRRTAVICGERSLAYAELDALADRAAAALLGLGLEPGERAAILSANRWEYAVLHYAAARAGIVLAHFSTRSTPRELAFMLQRTESRALFAQADSLPLLTAALEDGPERLRLVVLDHGFDAVLAGAAPRALPALTPGDPLGMTFTGGTTGQPKGVLVSHLARHWSVVSAAVEFGLDERDIAIVATPLFHTVGLHVWFATLTALGATSVMLRAWNADRFIDLVERHGASSSLLVPTQLGDLLRAESFRPERLRSLTSMHHAGAPMPPALLDRLEAALPWISFIEHYGQSETGPVTIRRPFHPRAKRGSIGRACHNVEARVVDEAGNPCAIGEIGEIVTRGPHLMTEYWREPEQTREAMRYGDGWLATGDLGAVDDDGFITLVDRVKDMIVSGGETIYPIEIENALARHPAVAESAVFGIPDERWGEVPAAQVVLADPLAATAADLAAFLAAEVARWKRPRRIDIVPSLPKTPVGKIQKSALRDPFWKGRARRI